MTLERIAVGIFIIIGILMIIAGLVAYYYDWIALPYAIFLVLGGIAVIIITIVISFIVL